VVFCFSESDAHRLADEYDAAQERDEIRKNGERSFSCTRDRAIIRAVLLRRRLGGDGSLLEPFPGRPKEMKRKTWWRLHAKGRRDEQRGLVGMAAAVASLTGSLRPEVRLSLRTHRSFPPH
jgi:hypothetical protein